MYLDPLHTPDPLSGNTPPPDPNTVINISLGMWKHLLQRLSGLETAHQALKLRYESTEREHYERSINTPKVTQEPKLPDPPMFSGERKDLLTFLAK